MALSRDLLPMLRAARPSRIVNVGSIVTTENPPAGWLAYTVALWGKLRLGGQRVTARAVWLALLDGLNGRFGGQNERVLAACAEVSTPQ